MRKNHEVASRRNFERNSPRDSEGGGLGYAVAALGARQARGGIVEEWEVMALVEKAKLLGEHDPDFTVRFLIEAWKDDISGHGSRACL